MAKANPKTTEFKVVLQGLKLPSDVERRIESEIRRAVMVQLASLDLKGDLKIDGGASKLRTLGGRIYGIVAEVA